MSHSKQATWQGHALLFQSARVSYYMYTCTACGQFIKAGATPQPRELHTTTTLLFSFSAIGWSGRIARARGSGQKWRSYSCRTWLTARTMKCHARRTLTGFASTSRWQRSVWSRWRRLSTAIRWVWDDKINYVIVPYREHTIIIDYVACLIDNEACRKWLWAIPFD